MPNCQSCGKPVAAGASFCLSCGAAQAVAPASAEPASVVPPEPVAPPVAAPPEPLAPSQPATQGPPLAWPAAPVGSAPPPDQVQPLPAHVPAAAAPQPPAAHAPAPQAYGPVAGLTAAGQPAGAAPPAARSGGLPGWGIALIVIAVIVVVTVPALLFIAPFYFAGRVVENVAPMIENQIAIANEKAVRQGVGEIQLGVEAWATDHNGKYPLVGQVDRRRLTQADGLGYMTEWPDNPYAGGPMTPGAGAGQYQYVRGPKGKSYTLQGYGENGTILVTVP